MSNETQWTPGPWNVEPCQHLIDKLRADTPTFYTASVTPASPGGYRGPICHMQSCEHINGIAGPECEANARLIATAPEMAALLERLAANCAADRYVERLTYARDARALLAKIKGATNA